MSHKFTSKPLFGCKLHLLWRIFSPLLVSVGNFSHFVCLIVCSLFFLLVCKLVCLCVTLKLTWMPTFICFFVVTMLHACNHVIVRFNLQQQFYLQHFLFRSFVHSSACLLNHFFTFVLAFMRSYVRWFIPIPFGAGKTSSSTIFLLAGFRPWLTRSRW